LANVLTAIGINADWIKAGILEGIKIIATEGNIAGMDITQSGLQRITQLGDYKYTNTLGMNDTNGFWLQSNNDGDTERAFVSTIFDADHHPVLNMSAVNNGEYDNSRLLLNGIPVVGDLATLTQKVSKMENYMITHFGYDPTAE
jgi:hypothetical protein